MNHSSLSRLLQSMPRTPCPLELLGFATIVPLGPLRPSSGSRRKGASGSLGAAGAWYPRGASWQERERL